LVRNANDRRVWRNLRDEFPHPYTREDATDWIRRASGAIPQTAFAIVVGELAVGGIGLRLREDVYRRSAEIGYWLGREHWGRGITSEAVQALTEWAFPTFDLCRIFAGVFEWNLASMRVLEKAGFRLEGRLRKAIVKDGETVDELLYALVR
jgi:RimJ/RimL family protein N-acetyltransferase